jgi:uncharacterized membrane-anchored protein
MRKLLVIGCALIILAGINFSIYQKQVLLADGQVIFLELAPVDPRSLMQGDYMALRFGSVERAIVKNKSKIPHDGRVVLDVADNGIALFKRFDNGEPLTSNEQFMRYRIRNNQPRFATNAFFFQEGHAHYYSLARYGEFRVADNGESILTGMRGEGLKKLGPNTEKQSKSPAINSK